LTNSIQAGSARRFQILFSAIRTTFLVQLDQLSLRAGFWLDSIVRLCIICMTKYDKIIYTHDKPPPASSFVTTKPEFVPLVFGLIIWIITHSFTIDRNPQALLTILICFTRWIVQKFKSTPRRFKNSLYTKPPFLAVCLRVKSNSCQDSIPRKNRLFFASDRILVGIGRAHSGTDTPASILPVRVHD